MRGALTVKTLLALRFPITPIVRQVTTNLVTSWEHGARTVRSDRRLLAAMTVRAELDHYVLEKTSHAGAHFETIGAIRAVRQSGTHLVLSTPAGELRCHTSSAPTAQLHRPPPDR